LQRQLLDLEAEHGFCRVAPNAKPTQWAFPKGKKPKKRAMSDYEALTLQLACEHVMPLFPRTLVRYLKPRLVEAKEVLRQVPSYGLRSWPERVRARARGVQLLPPQVDNPVLDAVYEALLRRRQLQTDYRKRQAKTNKSYEVNPLALVVRGSILALLCTVTGTEKVIQLHLHRMRAAKVLDKTLVMPVGFNLDKHIESGNLDVKLGESVRLKVLFSEFAAQTVEESHLSKDQIVVQQSDGRMLIEATVPDTVELRAWLMSYGPEVEVVEPSEIRESIVQRVKQMYGIYGVS
jgi:predicted DNA-binding transcriptional regulator YafY